MKRGTVHAKTTVEGPNFMEQRCGWRLACKRGSMETMLPNAILCDACYYVIDAKDVERKSSNSVAKSFYLVRYI